MRHSLVSRLGRREGVRSARSACGIAANPEPEARCRLFPCCRAFCCWIELQPLGKRKEEGSAAGEDSLLERVTAMAEE